MPLAGAYRLVNCSNHQVNLEVLCHACHAVVTAVARRSPTVAPATAGA